MIRLSRKFIKRSIIGLALLAPIVYLFGSLFFGLNGAHGTQLWAQVDDKDYSYTNDTFKNTWLDGNTGEVLAIQNSVISDYFPLFDLDNLTMRFSVVPDWLYFYSSDYSYISRLRFTEGFAFPSDSSYVRAGLYYAEPLFDTWTAYYSYPVSNPVISSLNFNEYIFKQFFAQNNFLTQWGRDAISETPHGFAPFGAMLKFVDDNMLHLSSEQIGLMGYGYFYYSAHVLLFVLMFDCTTFFISWCSAIFSKFGGKENGD